MRRVKLVYTTVRTICQKTDRLQNVPDDDRFKNVELEIETLSYVLTKRGRSTCFELTISPSESDGGIVTDDLTMKSE